MNTLTTLAELEAIPIGGVVRVENNDWVRTEKGLLRNDSDLALAYFEGALLRGVVSDVASMPPEVGQWWTGRTRYYFIHRVTEDKVYYQTFRVGSSVSLTKDGMSRLASWADSTTLSRLPEPPEAMKNNPELVNYVVAYGALLCIARERSEQITALTRRADELARKARVSAGSRSGAVASINTIRGHLTALEQLFEE